MLSSIINALIFLCLTPNEKLLLLEDPVSYPHRLHEVLDNYWAKNRSFAKTVQSKQQQICKFFNYE